MAPPGRTASTGRTGSTVQQVRPDQRAQPAQPDQLEQPAPRALQVRTEPTVVTGPTEPMVKRARLVRPAPQERQDCKVRRAFRAMLVRKATPVPRAHKAPQEQPARS